MKKKKLFIVLVTFILCLSFMIPSASAGNVQRNRWEGVAIGIGAALLGTAFIHHYRDSASTRAAVHDPYPPAPYYHRDRYRCKPSGHWEERKVWVQPVYKRVWNPSHYDRRGRWVPGHWIKIEKKPGYWTKERVWVSVY